MMKLIADIFGTIGMAFFLVAELYQLRKIRKTGNTLGLSWSTYRSKLWACIATAICFGLSGLLFSFVMIVIETIVIIPTMYLIGKGRE